LNSAVAGAMRGSHLTQRLLAFSRKTVLEPAAVDLNIQIASVREMLSRTLGNSITVETCLSERLWRTLVDPSQLEDSIINLAINARDGMPGGGTLTIETANVRLDESIAATRENARAGDYVMVAVRDTGIGIPAEILDKVLDPFFTTKAVGQGSGLGLSMVYGFVRQSDGHLRILSEPGQGTIVQLFLPRTLRELTVPTQSDSVAQSDSQGERILLVEDNPELLAAARRQLSVLGYRVRTAANGVTALQILASGEPFDLLLSDVVMPGGISGFELVAEARRRRPGLKALLMSGYADAAMADRDPPLRVLAKPYRRRELAEAIRDVLESPAPVAAE
jgi:CheY-like chemotaxis protein